MITNHIIKATVTTECTCVDYVSTQADSMVLEVVPAEFCYNCDEMNREDLENMIEVWLVQQPIQSNRVRIYGVGMGWQRRDGWTITDVTSLLDAVRLDGDYRIEFSLDGATLSAIRYSHDEPTGCVFAFKLLAEDEEA